MFVKNINRIFVRDIKNYYYLYILFLFGFVAYYLFQWPIKAYDTDLWYHLNTGRYIIEHGTIPKDSYFSFITPPREWVDYFWLFQVLVYKIYTFSGYYGLVFLRAIIFLFVSFLILRIMLDTDKAHQLSPYKRLSFFITFVFSLYLVFLLQRFIVIRPHILSFLFIGLFLYIIEIKPERTIFLPVLALLWVNIHGIVYPVMLLIVLAYLAEFFIGRIRNKEKPTGEELRYIIPLILCIATVYCTPHGSKLTWIPFIPTGFASHYINELKPMTFHDLFSFIIVNFIPNDNTIFNILFLIICCAIVAAIFDKRRRISHFILCAGGMVLLTKGIRFQFDFILLAIPVLRYLFSLKIHLFERTIVIRVLSIFLMAGLMLMPVLVIKETFKNMSRFPFAIANLPHGITTFLNKVDGSGNVLNFPNNGGYLQWELYPRYKIFMDMEVPFLFTNEDMFLAKNVFLNRTFLDKVIKQYNPSFISVPFQFAGFRDIIKHYPRYTIVFFDDMEVLYIQRDHFPHIAERFQFLAIDPFELLGSKVDYLNRIKDMKIFMRELNSIVDTYQESGIANQCLSLLYMRIGNYEKSLMHADKIINNYPESPTGYKLKAESLEKLERFSEAEKYYSHALKRKKDSIEIYRKIGMLYLKAGKHKKAYDTLVRSMNIYTQDTTYIDLYYLILAAVKSKKLWEAEILFRYAYKSIPETDRVWLERYDILRSHIGIKEPDVDGFQK